jgi:hypothetical protein
MIYIYLDNQYFDFSQVWSRELKSILTKSYLHNDAVIIYLLQPCQVGASSG